MKMGMIRYDLLTLFRDPANLFFGLGLPFVYLFLMSGLFDGDGTPYFLDRALPMFIIIAAMMLCFTCSGLSHAYSRQIKFLRRLRMTPVKPATYIVTGILSRIGILFIFAAVFIAFVALVYDLNIGGTNWFAFVGVLALAFAMFYLIGMFTANLLKNAKSSQGLLYFIFFALLLLGGVIFPAEAMPDVVQPIVQNTPTVHAINLLQSAWLNTDLLYGHSLVAIVGMTIVFGVLSILFFKFD